MRPRLRTLQIYESCLTDPQRCSRVLWLLLSEVDWRACEHYHNQKPSCKTWLWLGCSTYVRDRRLYFIIVRTNHFSPLLPCRSAILKANLPRSTENRYSPRFSAAAIMTSENHKDTHSMMPKYLPKPKRIPPQFPETFQIWGLLAWKLHDDPCLTAVIIE